MTGEIIPKGVEVPQSAWSNYLSSSFGDIVIGRISEVGKASFSLGGYVPVGSVSATSQPTAKKDLFTVRPRICLPLIAMWTLRQ